MILMYTRDKKLIKSLCEEEEHCVVVRMSDL